MMKNGKGAPLRGTPSQEARPPAVVRVRGLRVSRGGQEILHGLDLELAEGSITGLLGPSGCGKTTLMRTLVGVQRYEGAVHVLGSRPGAPATRGRVGYMTQGGAVYTDLTARQNVAYFASLAGHRSRDVEDVLVTVGRAIAEAGTAILVSSHVMDEAFRCDRVLLMRDGRFLAAATAAALLERTGAETLDEAFLAVIHDADAIEENR